jgi:hypothetical protein
MDRTIKANRMCKQVQLYADAVSEPMDRTIKANRMCKQVQLYADAVSEPKDSTIKANRMCKQVQLYAFAASPQNGDEMSVSLLWVSDSQNMGDLQVRLDNLAQAQVQPTANHVIGSEDIPTDYFQYISVKVC